MKYIYKHGIILLLSFFIIGEIHAQSDYFAQNQVDINVGVGFLPHYADDISLSVIPPLSLSVDYGVTDFLSVGIQGIYASAEEKNYIGVSNPRGKFSSIIVGGRVAYHFPSLSYMDTYVGGMAGYHLWNYDDAFDEFGFTSYSDPQGFIWSAYVGGRFVFSESVGVFFEAGYGITYVTTGINIAF